MFDFDRIIDRKGSDCVKWDMSPPAFQTRPGAAGPGSARQDSAGLLPLWVADMDFASPPAVCQAIRERAEHPVYGYALRPEGYLDAFADWMRLRHGAGVERPWLLSTPGIVAALAATIRAFSREGDGVCIMPPVYHPFARLIRANGRRVEEAPLRDEGGRYAIDLDALDTAASRSKLLILCSPHNPVGRVWTGAELEAIAEIEIGRASCRERV